MTPLLKRSTLTKRIKVLEKELSSVDHDLKALSDGKTPKRSRVGTGHGNTGTPERPGREAVGAPPEKMEQEVQKIGRKIHDRRFADYLSTSFQPVRPLRHERRIQRNKAILMAVVAALALFWVLYRFFL